MNQPDDGATRQPGEVVIPRCWPSAWPYLWRAVFHRGVFALAVAALTAVGIVGTGDPGAQWWIPLLPAVLLIGPARRPGRLRRMLGRAAVHRTLAVMPGRVHPGPVTSRGQTVRLVTPAGDAVGVPAFRGVAETLAVGHIGQSAVLVWVPRVWAFGRAPAALVLGDSLVAYLERVPRGARPVTIPTRLEERKPALLRSRR